MEKFDDILNLARNNVRTNPFVVGKDTYEKSQYYLQGLINEVKEVQDELKEDNNIYLSDELSDIVWNTAAILALLEERGLIDSADAVIEHCLTKYTERAPAFTDGSEEIWDTIKAKQKAELKERHTSLYS